MKSIKYGFIATTTLFASFSYAMQPNYRQATQRDLPAIDHFLATIDAKDGKNLVILPDGIRKTRLSDAVQKNRFFVATIKEAVIAFKKLFPVTGEELHGTLKDELSAVGEDGYYRAPALAASLHIDGGTSVDADRPTHLPPVDQSVFIYDGTDYTHPNFRRRGINSELTAYALKSLRGVVVKTLRDQKKNTLCLLYGLVTNDDAKDASDLLKTRTKDIAPVFADEVTGIRAALGSSAGPINLDCARFPASKPEFDKDGNLLPDGTPGYGYLLSHTFQEIK